MKEAGELAALALTTDLRGMNADSGGEGPKRQAVSQEGLNGDAIVGSQLPADYQVPASIFEKWDG